MARESVFFVSLGRARKSLKDGISKGRDMWTILQSDIMGRYKMHLPSLHASGGPSHTANVTVTLTWTRAIGAALTAKHDLRDTDHTRVVRAFDRSKMAETDLQWFAAAQYS